MKCPYSHSVAGCVLFALSVSPYVSAESYFADGVSVTGGWFDVNKIYVPGMFFKVKDQTLVQDTEAIVSHFTSDSDKNLCWAGTASNIIEYMNVRSGHSTVYSDYYNKAESIENSKIKDLAQTSAQYASYQTYVENFEDEGYTTVDGLAWYTTGTTAYHYANSSSPISSGATGGGGYYRSSVGTTVEDFQNNVIAHHYQVYGQNYAGNYVKNDLIRGTKTYVDLFSDALESGPIALSINKLIEGEFYNGHAITCWGYETDENGDLSALYITDSDDGVEKLRTIGVTFDSTTGLLSLLETEATNVYCYDANGNLTNYYYPMQYEKTDGYVLTSLASFNNFIAPIPEPSTCSLLFGLGTLSIIVSRRRCVRLAVH